MGLSGETPAETSTEPQLGVPVEPPVRGSSRAGVYGVLIVILLLAVVVV